MAAKLIVKCPYKKGGAETSGHLEYIGTRDGVEIPERSGYLGYMAERPRSHGLFSDKPVEDLDAAKAEITATDNNVWMNIFSLKREDAERMGYDNADAWQALLRSHRNEIAIAMKIEPEDFRWYAAFHNEGNHPRVHMMAWSAKPGGGYLKQAGIRKIKSVLTNDIFKNELMPMYAQKSEHRDALITKARELMSNTRLVKFQEMDLSDDFAQALVNFSEKVKNVKGKHSYGYLSKPLKKEVNALVDLLAQAPEIAECYNQWKAIRKEIYAYYGGEKPEEVPLSEQKEFLSVKNAIIQAAWELRVEPDNSVTYKEIENEMSAVIAVVAQVFEDKTPQPPMPHQKIDRKRLEELRKKKMAQGHSENDFQPEEGIPTVQQWEMSM